MADLTDVCTFLYQECIAAVYPGGTSSPSVAAMDVRVMQGWPLPEQLDLDLAGNMLGPTGQVIPRPGGKCASVSVYPMAGTNVVPYQLLDETYVVVPPVHGMTSTIAGSVITLSGTPGAGEFVTVEADNTVIASATGASATAILGTLAAQLLPQYPGTVASGNTLTVPGTAYLTCRIGAACTLGKVSHRERQMIMVSVWAPDPASRTALAIAIDVLLKQNLTPAMPDGSMALLTYNRTNQSDEKENVNIYRRDLIMQAEYATVTQFQGFEITSVTTVFTGLDMLGNTVISDTTAS